VTGEDVPPDASMADIPRTRGALNEAAGEASTSGRGSREVGSEAEADEALAHLNSLFDDDRQWGVGLQFPWPWMN